MAGGAEHAYQVCMHRAGIRSAFAGSGVSFAIAGGGLVLAVVVLVTKRDA
jgi:hypothetical protein